LQGDEGGGACWCWCLPGAAPAPRTPVGKYSAKVSAPRNFYEALREFHQPGVAFEHFRNPVFAAGFAEAVEVLAVG
jgi:hypothetical protein